MRVVEHYQEMAREVRGDTLRILQATTPQWLTWAPPGTSNHILWHAGHALWLQDALCLRPLTGRTHLPSEWEQRFGMRCRPVASTRDWPPREELAMLLRQQLTLLLDVLANIPDADLTQHHPKLGDNRTLGGWIMHALYDEAKHSGEMYLLWKMTQALVKPAIGSP